MAKACHSSFYPHNTGCSPSPPPPLPQRSPVPRLLAFLHHLLHTQNKNIIRKQPIITIEIKPLLLPPSPSPAKIHCSFEEAVDHGILQVSLAYRYMQVQAPHHVIYQISCVGSFWCWIRHMQDPATVGALTWMTGPQAYKLNTNPSREMWNTIHADLCQNYNNFVKTF
jgi:hypothetical protein